MITLVKQFPLPDHRMRKYKDIGCHTVIDSAYILYKPHLVEGREDIGKL